MGHLLGGPDRLYLFQSDDLVGAVGGAVAAVDTDLGFVLLSIPEHRAKGTGLDTVPTADAQVGFETHTPFLSWPQGVGGADAGAGWVGAGAADDDDESLADAASRTDVDTGAVQSAVPQLAGAGEHTGLAADAAVYVHYR